MKRKILSILVLCFAQPCLKASQDLVPAGAAICSTQATTEELLRFFRDGPYVVVFPEGAFYDFFYPFLTKKHPSRLAEMRAQKAALLAAKEIVDFISFVFTQELARLNRPVIFDGRQVDQAPDREGCLKYYQKNNHGYFLKFQEMFMQVLAWAESGPMRQEAKRVLKNPHGISQDLGFLWMRDNRGIVPMPYDHKELGSLIFKSSYPYGYWGDLLQRGMVIDRGRLVESSGIYIYTKDGSVFRFVQENGVSKNFITSPLSIRMEKSWEEVVILRCENVFEISIDGYSHAFIPFPSTPDEQKEFEAVLLEELQANLAAGGSEAVFAEGFLSAYVRSLEWREPGSGEAPAKEADTPAIAQDILSHQLDDLYEAQVRKHQEEISRQVSEGTVVGRPQKAQKGGKKKSSAASFSKSNAEAEDKTSLTDQAAAEEAKAALKAKILNDLKKQGRVKWRTLARMIIARLKSEMNGDRLVIDCAGRGSHFGLRLQGAHESAGLTVVRPHGKADRTVSAGEARGLADQLIDLMFKALRQQ